MVTYVDDMHRYPVGRFGRMKMSHLMADTDAELYAIADKIGVARRWVQDADKPSDIHFDIALVKRALAVEAGAVEITYREMSAYAWHRRMFGRSIEPASALVLFGEYCRLQANKQPEAANG